MSYDLGSVQRSPEVQVTENAPASVPVESVIRISTGLGSVGLIIGGAGMLAKHRLMTHAGFGAAAGLFLLRLAFERRA